METQPHPQGIPTQSKTSGMAIASLVCGILSIWLGLPALLGIIFGIIALRQINGSAGVITGTGLAIGGLVTSALGMIVIFAMLLPELARAKQKAPRMRCASNLRQIGLALRSFADDHDSRMPWLMPLSDQISVTEGLTGAAPYPGQHPANRRVRDVSTVFLIADIRQGLSSARTLLSPCDPAAAPVNETLELNFNTLQQLDPRGLSYSVCHGGDEQLPSTIMAVTRNTQHMTLKPDGSRAILRQSQLKWMVSHKPGDSTRFIGADEITETSPPAEIRRLSPLIMGKLMKGQGQVALGDGSVDQMNATEFDQQISSHLASKGGVTIGQPQTSLSRPTQPIGQ